MPSLSEGIQYVGMLKPQTSDYEYMITDMDGVIDSFTKGITGMLGLTPNLFKDKDSQINIQILAPDLISFFLDTQQKGRPVKSRYRDQGGDQLTLIVPQNFHMICKSESKQNNRAGTTAQSRSKSRGISQANRGRSTVFKQFLKVLSKPRKFQRERMPTAKQLLSQPEYVQCERKKEVQCEITCLEFKAKTPDVVKLLIFKFSKSERNQDRKKSNENLMQYIDDMERDRRRQKLKQENEFEEFKIASIDGDALQDQQNLMHPQIQHQSKRQNSYQVRRKSSLRNPPSKTHESSNKKVAFSGENNFNSQEQEYKIHTQRSSHNGGGAFVNQNKSSSHYESQSKDMQLPSSYQQALHPSGKQLLNQNNNHKGSSASNVFNVKDLQQSQAESANFAHNQVHTIRSEQYDGNNQTSKSKQSVHSIQEIKQEESSDADSSSVTNNNNQNSNNLNQEESKKSKYSSSQQQQSSKQQNQASQRFQQQQQQQMQDKDDDSENQNDNDDDVETPRLDLSGIKLESAQKEKNSFLEELRKQSFMLSEINNRQEGNNNNNSSSNNNNPQNKQSNANSNILGDKRDGSMQSMSMLQHLQPDQMVKKQNLNNINKIFSGDAYEPQDTIPDDEDQSQSQNSPQNRNGQKSQRNQQQQQQQQQYQMDDDESHSFSSDNNNNIKQATQSQQKSKSQKSSKLQSNSKMSDKKDTEEENKDQSEQSSDDSNESDNEKKNNNDKNKSRSSQHSTSQLESSITHSSQKIDDTDNVTTNLLVKQQQQQQKPSQFQRQVSKRNNNNNGNGVAVINNNVISPIKANNGHNDDDSDDENKNLLGDNSGNYPPIKKHTGNQFMRIQPTQQLDKDPPRITGLSGINYHQQRDSNDNYNDRDDDEDDEDDIDGSGGENRNGGGGHSKYFKRDTNKIHTNPKYKCVDEGSEDENAVAKSNLNDDGQQQSSKELQFRENFLKFERRKKRKERKAKEKELKKIKALNGEDSSMAASLGDEATGGRSTAGGSASDDDDDDDSSSSSSSSSSEESKELNQRKGAKGNFGRGNTGKGQNNKSGHQNPKDAKSDKNDDGEISSITTRQNKTERYHYILRMAIDEKYVPSSISNIRFAAYFIFSILAVLSIAFYAVQTSLFDKMSQNIRNIHNSEQRLNYIIDITLRTRTLAIANNGLLNLSPLDKETLINTTLSELRSSATKLKDAQADLSLQTSSIHSDQLQKINPSDIKLIYKQYPDMPSYYYFTIWEAIMELVVSAYRISTLKITDLVDSQPTVYFVLQNCLNTVYIALKSSTEAILGESTDTQNYNMSVFLYLLITATCALTFSLLFLIPVINKVTKSKQEVIKLFTLKAIEKHIDDQLKVCRNFISTKLQQSNDQGDHNGDIDGDEANMVNDKELQNELNNNKYLKRIKKKNKGKKMKELSTNFGSTLLKFVLFLCIIEGYFLANYLLSQKFLTNVQDLTQELKLLISRQPVQSFLLMIQKELIYTNGTALIEGQPSITYVPSYQDQLYDEEEQLLDKFSQNYDSHSSSYNDEFNNIIYSDVCQYVKFNNQTECEQFNQGILKKGIYSSVIKYWDFIRQLNHDFLESNRTNATIKAFLNDQRLQTAERMQDYYFKVSLSLLVNKLEADIQNFFDVEFVQNRTLFIIYMIYIVILYLFIWRKFMSIMSNELWRTKTMLSVLPTKICFEVKEIREVIQKNSSNDFVSSKM